MRGGEEACAATPKAVAVVEIPRSGTVVKGGHLMGSTGVDPIREWNIEGYPLRVVRVEVIPPDGLAELAEIKVDRLGIADRQVDFTVAVGR